MEAIEQPTPDQLARRKAARERKQRQRSKEKARSDRAVQAYQNRIRAEKVNADGLARQIRRNLCTLGEVSPGVDAATVEEALQVAREMARALGALDVQPGESLFDFESRIFESWINFEGFVGHNDAVAGGGGAPYLHRESGQLFPGFGREYWLDHGGFEKCWTPLPGAMEEIDIASLSELKPIKSPEEPKPEPKPTPRAPTPVVPPQPDAVHFGWVPPQAHQFLASGRSDVHM